jgi:hypothetical protein
VETLNRDLHSRVDRLEMGLREGLAGYIPAPPSIRPAVTAVTHEPGQPDDPGPDADDPIGSAVPR